MQAKVNTTRNAIAADPSARRAFPQRLCLCVRDRQFLLNAPVKMLDEPVASVRAAPEIARPIGLAVLAPTFRGFLVTRLARLRAEAHQLGLAGHIAHRCCLVTYIACRAQRPARRLGWPRARSGATHLRLQFGEIGGRRLVALSLGGGERIQAMLVPSLLLPGMGLALAVGD